MYMDNTINTQRSKWEIEDDVRTLKRAAEIRNDPTRVRDAQNYILNERATEASILGLPTPPPMPGRSNPATIMKLNNKF